MEYHEAANFLFDLRRYPSRTGVAPTRRLLEHLGVADPPFQVIQIGGSNGKGSTARMVESVLREAGYDVGLYTSPHLDDVRERVRIDGRPVAKRAVREYVETIQPYVRKQTPDGTPPTFFEAVTGLAVHTFAQQGVDVAVLEVGIGGEHDATSALSPEAAAVTNVTLEHADLLGDTVEEIAQDKAAIAPSDRPLVTAADGSAFDAITQTAGETLRVGSTEDDAEIAVST
ncbi:bifunctional folylpolyglutamate synthase/dihydrofolate synthase, partial [Natronomonas sp.]|uniref:bifunctional folylpolyglutamate synthase/dihydrofolate synthase n=1 Tax=Natronomonas sp. TaxID=2184060 RepID=UPI003988A7F0